MTKSDFRRFIKVVLSTTELRRADHRKVSMSPPYPSDWKKKASWPSLRFTSDESVVLLVVGEPWTFNLPAGRNKPPKKRHVANVILLQSLNRSLERRCLVWEMSDYVFNLIPCDPTTTWIKVTRRGSGKKGTSYEVSTYAKARDAEIEIARTKLAMNLELVATEIVARKERELRRFKV